MDGSKLVAPYCVKCGSSSTRKTSGDSFYCLGCSTFWSDRGWTVRMTGLRTGNLPLGTPVEHPFHGVAAYAGHTVLSVDGLLHTYIKLEYQGQSWCYVPIERAGTLKVQSTDTPIGRMAGPERPKESEEKESGEATTKTSRKTHFQRA